MVHFIKKKIKNKVYLYLEHRARINGQSKRVWQKYLGPEETITDQIGLLVAPDFEISTYDFGLPVALMQLVNRLDLITIINECTVKRQQGLSVGEYTVIAVLNRCVQPRSKSQLQKWFYATYLQQLFPKIETYFDSMAYTNHFPYLTEAAIEAIEQRIHDKLLTEFQVKMDEIFYDPTNFSTFIHPQDQELPRHGHAKDGRHVLNLVNLSVFCSRDGGIPLIHQVYPGNVQDAAQFKLDYPKFLTRLHQLGIAPSDIILIFDKGNISVEVFQEIDASGVHWIASVRPSSHKDLQPLGPDAFPRAILPNGKEVGLLEFPRSFHGQTRRLIVSYNPRRAQWQGDNLTRKLQVKREEIHAWFKERLNTRKWRAADKVEAKIRGLIQEAGYAEFMTYEVKGAFGQVSYTVQLNEAALQAHLRTLGKSFFMTNHPTHTPLEVVWLYRQQFTIERAFKYLKSPTTLRVTPIFHWKDACIQGHLFTCVLGLLLLMLLCRQVEPVFPELSLFTILDLLSEIQVAEIKVEGSRKIIKKLVGMSTEAKKLADLFALDHVV